jgi:hypothetical protein
MASVTFEATVERDRDSGGTFVTLPFDVRAEFGRARPPVRVTVKGHTWRTTISVYGGIPMLGFSRANRDAAGFVAGERISVTIESDEAPRTVDVPPDLAAALAAAPDARSAFDAMSFTHRLEYVRWLDEAKRPETRLRRVAASIERIRAGRVAG